MEKRMNKRLFRILGFINSAKIHLLTLLPQKKCKHKKHRQTQKNTDKHKKTQTNTKKHRQTQKNTDKHKKTQTNTKKHRQTQKFKPNTKTYKLNLLKKNAEK